MEADFRKARSRSALWAEPKIFKEKGFLGMPVAHDLLA